MNKQIIILIITIAMLVIAGITADSFLRTDSTVTFDKATTDALVTRGINKIEVQASPMICDSSECWSDVKQSNLINTQFRTPKNYCSETKKEEVLNSDGDTYGTVITCLKYSDYTLAELTAMRDNFVKSKIEGYAKTIIASAPTQLDDGGIIVNSK